MAIGIVSDTDFEKELNRGDKSPPPELRPAQVVDINRGGRSDGDTNVPDSLRNIIGEEAVTNGRASALAFAKMFGVSDSSVSAYTDGKTSTSAISKNQKLTEHLRTAKLRVSLKARRKLDDALNQITEEKLADAKLTDVAMVAKYMSGVIRDMAPEKECTEGSNNNFNGPSIVLFNPGFTKEDKFDTVEASE